ncbi:hypothetical protein BVC80_1751g110 [Macleaya cordata]|uniref:Uncharacterized protein n=1 Tax=Macleaya cordata TaxID=56857 RepID=A0A200QHQ7_MACCD|nr:hypothetical protein BVC80_1751g110 [Macleaya cordata]
MKTISGSVISSKPVSLSKAASILSSFISFENGASHALSAYLRRTSASLDGLVEFHDDLLKCGKSERKRKKTRLETIDNGILTDAEKNYSLREEQSTGYTEEGRGSDRKKKKKKRRSDFQDQLPEVEERESEEHRERKKRKKMEVEVGELDDAEERNSRVKKRKH